MTELTFDLIATLILFLALVAGALWWEGRKK